MKQNMRTNTNCDGWWWVWIPIVMVFLSGLLSKYEIREKHSENYQAGFYDELPLAQPKIAERAQETY